MLCEDGKPRNNLGCFLASVVYNTSKNQLLNPPSSRSDMKRWTIAKRKMAWQVTGDRNIGGHTARIPDHINFLSGDGPRGVGIDLSSKGANSWKALQ